MTAPCDNIKILITNTCALNGGDAAILQSLIQLLRETFSPHCDITAYDNQSQAAAKYYPDINFRTLLYHHSGHTTCPIPGLRYLIRRLKRWAFFTAAWAHTHHLPALKYLITTPDLRHDLKRYQQADLIISTGGTYLTEHGGLKPRTFDYALCRWLKKPLIFFTQSLGPFTTPATRRQMARVFHHADLILLRDPQSQDHLLDLGISPEKIKILPDVVFSWYTPNTHNTQQPVETSHSPAPLRIAISVRHWMYFNNTPTDLGMNHYQQTIADLTAHLVRRHHAHITFISTCQGCPEYWADDSAVADQILSRLPADLHPHITVNHDFHQPRDLLQILRGFDLVVATRMHMAILSLIAGAAVLPIAYEFKTKQLFQQLGLGSWPQDISTLDTATLISAADDLIAQRHHITRQTAQQLNHCADQARLAAQLTRQTYDSLTHKHKSYQS